MIDYQKVKDDAVAFIKTFFSPEYHSADCNAVIGISGGKDSTVAAALCAEALGPDRVIGVLMPCGEQSDIDDSREVCSALGIANYTVNIGPMFDNLVSQFAAAGITPTEQMLINAKPRLRMTTLYAIAQSHNGRVCNNTNLSELFVGYGTKFGDLAGDFALFRYLRKTDVVEIGKLCTAIPQRLIVKPPSDGLTGMTDEDKFGFTYEQLDNYLLTGTGDEDVWSKIREMHLRAGYCQKSIPTNNVFHPRSKISGFRTALW